MDHNKRLNDGNDSMGTLPLPLPSGRASRRARAADRIRALLAGLRSRLGMRRSQASGDKGDEGIARSGGGPRKDGPDAVADRR
jgi:hypothetical protein